MTHNTESDPTNILAFDYGTRFIGVAIGNSLIKNAKGLTTIECLNKTVKWDLITKLINKWQPDYLVVGEPLTLDGNRQYLTEQVDKFIRQLVAKFGLEVFKVDERLTSRLAQDEIRASKKSIRKPLIDKMAAQIILQTWFDTNAI